MADYFTKHHPPAHHRNVREIFLTRIAEVLRLRQEQATTEVSLVILDNGYLQAKGHFDIAQNSPEIRRYQLQTE